MRLLISALAAMALAACGMPAAVNAPGAASAVPPAAPAPTTPPAETNANARVFTAAGREVSVEGGVCTSQPGGLESCAGDIVIGVLGAESLPPIRLREMILTNEFSLHVGEGALAKPGATPSLALVDYDRNGSEDLAVAVDRLGGYGQLSYAIYLRRADGWALSPEFSALTEGRMGLPRREGDVWVASGKSGCCQHWDERYDVVDGKPVLRDVEVKTSNADGTTRTEVLRGEAALARARGEL